MWYHGCLTCPTMPGRYWFICLCHFCFNDTATTEIYTLSLHDALPISRHRPAARPRRGTSPRSREPIRNAARLRVLGPRRERDRKSTRLNSSHANISYAVFCLKKKQCKGSNDNVVPENAGGSDEQPRVR